MHIQYFKKCSREVSKKGLSVTNILFKKHFSRGAPKSYFGINVAHLRITVDIPIRKTDKNFLVVERTMYHLCFISSLTFFYCSFTGTDLFYIGITSVLALLTVTHASL